MKKGLLSFCLLLVATIAMAGVNDLLWDYTDAAPASSPDNGMYFASKVADAAGTNLGLKGIKLNSSGYAYFEKAAVAGKLKLTISNRKTTDAFQVNVSHGTLSGTTATKGALIAVSPAAEGPTTVTVDLDETATGIYIDRNTGAEGVLIKCEFVENVARTFVDFELNFMNISELPATPSGVVSMVGTPRNDDHGLNNDFRMVVPVDGPVKFTFGGCGYSGTNVTVQDKSGATLASIDVKSPGCYHNTGGTATYTYKGGVDTLTIIGAQYNPYIKAEAVEVKPATLKFMDQNGVKLAEYELEEGDNVIIPDSLLSKVTVPAGQKFRGWKYSNGKLASTSDLLTGNATINACVTNIETAATGTHYKFNLNNATDYLTDHDLIMSVGSGYFHDGSHGWTFANGDQLKVVVSPKAYVSVGLCTYTNTSDQVIRNAAGDSVAVMHVIKDKEEGAIADGTLCSFYYANANNAQDTLVFNFTTTSYIHFVEVYNVSAPLNKVGQKYDIAAGDAGSFMLACAQLQNGDTIQLHDGVYDLGETVLTTISASNVVVRGESMTGTIVKNAPNIKKEGISTTATILNTGNDNVFENLTLQNAMDYYSKNDGRGVVLQDKGTRTACYSVRMLSYQDTYYSNKPGQQCWFEDCEIHGTVDYICGSGSVYFYNTLLYCEKRNANGGGEDCITANNSQTAQQDKGYVFDRCTIKSECPTVSLSRTWNDQPQVAYLLTTIDTSAGEFGFSSEKIQRWTISGMNNVDPYDFSEYNTMDMNGTVISPESNVVNFWGKTDKAKETIIGYEAAEAKTYPHFFRDGWNPARNYVAFPAPAEPKDSTYYIKHPWGTGLDADWSWKAMRDTVLTVASMSLEASYVEGLWGDHGFNIKNEALLSEDLWFEKALVSAITPEGVIVNQPAKGTPVTFAYLHQPIAQVVGGGQAWIIVPTATSLETVGVANSATKCIENGQLFIIRNGVKYNAAGIRCK